MNFLIFKPDISKEELLQWNIVIDENSIVADGVKIGCGVCILNSKIGGDVEVGANSVIENSVIGNRSKIMSSVIKDSSVGTGVTVGPFAHVRNGAVIGDNCRIGNFVEIKKSSLGSSTKVAHLTYVGDASIGMNCNLGCGVVFCNYNGAVKQSSIVGDNVFIGSNVNIIAPVTIENGAYIAAGSTINKDIGVDEFAIARARQENKKDFKNPYKKQ